MRLTAYAMAFSTVLVLGCGNDATPPAPDQSVGGNDLGVRIDAAVDSAMAPAFPAGFLWGSATAAHEVEGGNTNNDWSVWESLPNKIMNGDKTGIADDHYHLYDQDLAKAQAMGHNAYRFSIEWSRIEPTQGTFSQTEIDHYKAMVASCKAHGLKPLITLEHFTLPKWVLNPDPAQIATSLGGWTNKATADAFVAYVTHVIPFFINDVDVWITLNEPNVLVTSGYFQTIWPPGTLFGDFAGGAKAYANQIDAHARSYDAIHAAYKAANKPVTVTVAQHYVNFDPMTPGTMDDVAAKTLDHVFNKLFLDAIINGDVDTDLMGTIVHHPEYVGKADIIGMNYYKRNLVQYSASIQVLHGYPSDDDSKYHSDLGWGLYPEGFLRALRDIKTTYNLPILITENGVADGVDKYRSWFFVNYLQQLQMAIGEGIDVRGYIHWTLLDNFEWNSGFTPRSGIMAVDYASPMLTRTVRPSSAAFTAIIQAGAVTPDIVAKYGAAP